MAGGGGFFEAGRSYQRTDVENAGYEFRCVSVSEAPQPGALGRFAFGFQIDRGAGCLHRWLPAVMVERNPARGVWAECGVFQQ